MTLARRITTLAAVLTAAAALVFGITAAPGQHAGFRTGAATAVTAGNAASAAGAAADPLPSPTPSDTEDPTDVTWGG